MKEELISELSAMANQMRRIADKMDSVPEQACINRFCLNYNVMYDQQCQVSADEYDNPLIENCEEYYSALSWLAQELRGAADKADTWIEGIKGEG